MQRVWGCKESMCVRGMRVQGSVKGLTGVR